MVKTAQLHWEHLPEACVSVLAWTLAATLISFGILRKRSLVYSNRVVSLLHALIALPLCIAAARHWNPLPYFGRRTTAPELRVLLISLGYFVYDTVACALIEDDRANAAHHLCSIAAVAVGIFQEWSGTELVSCLLLMELTNPFLHLRFFIREHGMGHSKIGAINDVVFAVSFALCRLVFGPFITFGTIFCPTSSPIVKVGGAGIQIVSCLWCYKICRMAMRNTKRLKSDAPPGPSHKRGSQPQGTAAINGVRGAADEFERKQIPEPLTR